MQDRELERTGDDLKFPKTNLDWTEGLLEEECLSQFRNVTKEVVKTLLAKGYSRFEIESIMTSDVTTTLIWEAL